MQASRRHLLLGTAATAAGAALPTIARAEPMKIGVLIPGSIADKGFMESAHTGYQAALKKHGDKVALSLIENINYADMEQVVTTLASKNQCVLSVSGASQASMLKVAKRFPNVKFNIVGGAKIQDDTNVAQYDVRQAEIAHLAGATAAMFSKTGVVSYIGGLEIPGIVNAGKEFALGAQGTNAGIKVLQNFTGNFDDVAKAKEVALAHVAQGADVHYHILNLGLRGLEQTAKEKSTRLIGGYTARCGTDPLYVAYTVTGVGYLLGYAVDQWLAGSWKPGSKPFGLQMGAQASDMVICSGATAQMTMKLDQLKKDIVAGSLRTLDS